MKFNTRTTHPNQSDRPYGDGVLLIIVQCHRYLYPYHDIKKYLTIQLKAHLEPDSIKSSNTPAWPYQQWYWVLIHQTLRVALTRAPWKRRSAAHNFTMKYWPLVDTTLFTECYAESEACVNLVMFGYNVNDKLHNYSKITKCTWLNVA